MRTISLFVLRISLGMVLLGTCACSGLAPELDEYVQQNDFELCSEGLMMGAPEGWPCESNLECQGGLCVGADEESVCAQMCVPDRCGNTCSEGAACLGLTLADGTPYAFDIDGDGVSENVGACLQDRSMERLQWEPCNFGDSCPVGARCISLPGGSICAPDCDHSGICDLHQNFLPQCFDAGGAGTCVVLCDPGNGVLESCPTGLRCQRLQGVGVCAPCSENGESVECSSLRN